MPFLVLFCPALKKRKIIDKSQCHAEKKCAAKSFSFYQKKKSFERQRVVSCNIKRDVLIGHVPTKHRVSMAGFNAVVVTTIKV